AGGRGARGGVGGDGGVGGRRARVRRGGVGGGVRGRAGGAGGLGRGEHVVGREGLQDVLVAGVLAGAQGLLQDSLGRGDLVGGQRAELDADAAGGAARQVRPGGRVRLGEVQQRRRLLVGGEGVEERVGGADHARDARGLLVHRALDTRVGFLGPFGRRV